VPAGGSLSVTSDPASVTISYIPADSTIGAPENASGLLTALAAALKGVGPGTSLADKVAAVQRALAALDTRAACGVLTGLANQLSAQSGKQVPAGTAAQRLADVRTIQGLLRC